MSSVDLAGAAGALALTGAVGRVTASTIPLIVFEPVAVVVSGLSDPEDGAITATLTDPEDPPITLG